MATIDPWRDVGIYLKANVGKDDLVFNIGGVPINYYTGFQLPVLGTDAVKFITTQFDAQKNVKDKRIWLVLSNPKYKREGDEALVWLKERASQRFEKKYLYDPDYKNKAKYFNKDFYEYRINVYLFEQSQDLRRPTA